MKPCGAYHSLPCGLDVECRVPVKFYDATLSNEQVWEDFNDQ